jgi:hypothetical protein
MIALRAVHTVDKEMIVLLQQATSSMIVTNRAILLLLPLLLLLLLLLQFHLEVASVLLVKDDSEHVVDRSLKHQPCTTVVTTSIVLYWMDGILLL